MMTYKRKSTMLGVIVLSTKEASAWSDYIMID